MAVDRYGRLALAAADLNVRPLAAANYHTPVLPESLNYL